MAGLLSCLWGEPNESPRQQGFDLVLEAAAKRAKMFGIQGAKALEQVDQCSINEFVVEESAAQQVNSFALQEGKACGVVQEALRLEGRQRKEVAPRRRSLCAKA